MHTPKPGPKSGQRITSLIAALMMFFIGPVYAVKAPDFSLPGTIGNSVVNTDISLERYSNKVIYVDFWASWCVPCKKSFPWMNAMQERYGNQGFKIIAINLDEHRKDAEEFLKQVPAEFVIAYDPSGKTAERYDLSVMPSSYLIDRKGKLVGIHKGFKSQDKEEMEQKIRALVEQK